MIWHSQAGQDEWVHSIIGDSGYFVDVGAHDGIVHSNTYALEQHGWTGLCVEPNRDVFEELRSNRTCQLSSYAISDTDNVLAFNGVQVGAGPLVECRTLTTVLDLHRAPPVIDYLSIDVEGHELEVLAGMDFDRWEVRLITVEHNLYSDGPGRKEAIWGFLGMNGFRRIREDVVAPGYGVYEDWYANGDMNTAFRAA